MPNRNSITKTERMIIQMLFLLGIALGLAASVSAQKVDCLECHKDLTQGKIVHAAIQMGCDTCHTGVDASSIPHKFTGTKGLKANPPGLCYGCHSKEEFTKAVRHSPVAAGMCMSCHNPHSSSGEALLLLRVNKLCVQCHADIANHVKISIPPFQIHPLEGPSDPNRKGKSFDCVSCHMPHSSAWGKLFRYDAKDAAGLCKHCHDFMQ